METYLTQKFNEIYRDISPKSRVQCLSLTQTYSGLDPEGCMKGFKLRTLDDLLVRKEKGDRIISQLYNDPKVSVEAKTAMDIIKSTFIEYTNSPEAQIDTWREKHLKRATKGFYELSMVYQGREFNGEKSARLVSIEDRYRRANQIILKHARKDLTPEKLEAIKDLAKRFTDYEQTKPSKKSEIRETLREKNQEEINTLEKFAEYHKITKKPQEQTQNILSMPVEEAAKKIWNTTKAILFTKIF